MRVDVNRMIFLEHVAERIRDAARQDAGESRADADDLHVRDGAQAGYDAFEFAVAHHQRIAARQQNVADLRVAADVVDPHRNGLFADRRWSAPPFACACRTGNTSGNGP